MVDCGFVDIYGEVISWVEMGYDLWELFVFCLVFGLI